MCESGGIAHVWQLAHGKTVSCRQVRRKFDSDLTKNVANAQRLRSQGMFQYGGGGTECSGGETSRHA